MCKYIYSVLKIISLFSITPFVFAVDCSQILKHGLFDNYYHSESLDYSILSRDWFCKSKTSMSDKSNNYDLSGKILDFGLTVGAKAKANNFYSLAETLCKENNLDEELEKETDIFWKKASRSIIKAWDNCVKNENSAKGFFAIAEYDKGDPKYIRFTLLYRPVHTNADRIDFVIEGVRNFKKCPINSGVFPTSIPPNTRRTFECERENNDKPASIIINTSDAIVNVDDNSNIIRVPEVIPVKEQVKIGQLTLKVNDFGSSYDSRSWVVNEIQIFDADGKMIRVKGVESSSCFSNCGNSAGSNKQAIDGKIEPYNYWAPSQNIKDDRDEFITLIFDPISVKRVDIYQWSGAAVMKRRKVSGDKYQSEATKIILSSDSLDDKYVEDLENDVWEENESGEPIITLSSIYLN